MKKRVSTLYRVSTIGQVEKDDIPMQKEACHEFAERQGWEIVKEFSEKGVSGFKKSAKDRDQLQLLQQAAAAGEFDVLLVFMFDRLGRRDDETPYRGMVHEARGRGLERKRRSASDLILMSIS